MACQGLIETEISTVGGISIKYFSKQSALGLCLNMDIELGRSTGQREWYGIVKVIKGRKLQPRILYPARLLFRFDREIKSFIDKQKLGESSTTKPALQQMLKEFL